MLSHRRTMRRGDLEFGTIPGLLELSVRRFGSKIAIRDDDRELSFETLASEVERIAGGLIALGVQAGDRVAIWAPNQWEWIVAALATHCAGGVLVPINTRYRGQEANYILEKSQANILLTVTDFLGTDYPALLGQAASKFAGSIIAMRGPVSPGQISWAELCELGKRESPASIQSRRANLRGHDPSDILFTSGTTGQPKGAVCTHAQTLRAYYDWSDVVGLREDDRYLVVAPFFHCFGYKAGWLACLMTGATIYPHAVFEVEAVLRRVAAEKITVLPGPPALYQSILALDDLGERDLGSLRLAVTGAAVIPVELVERMRTELGFQTVITGYGLTEASGIATMCRFDDEDETIARTSGRAIPGVEIKIVDEQGNPLPANTPGEVWVRGYNVMCGYFDEPAETEASITDDGFLRTGDIGEVDERGYLRVTDRKKDMFIVGGFNAYPAEIENALLTHPDIAHAAVIGVPDGRLGEVGMAFVVPRSGATSSEDQVIAFCRDRLANFKVPRRVLIVDDLPRNASGKVQKFKLRQMAAG